MGTNPNVGITPDAFFAVPEDRTGFRHGQGARGASRNAFPAVPAALHGFRIMTEPAMERAALKKDGRPVSWAVHIGKGNNPVNRGSLHDAESFCPEHGRRPERPCRKE